jgi:type VI secretion system secreted protein VgrG
VESAIELNANGKINLIGKEFNFFVEGDGISPRAVSCI